MELVYKITIQVQYLSNYLKTTEPPTKLPPVGSMKRESAFRSMLNKGTKRFSSHFADKDHQPTIASGSLNGDAFEVATSPTATTSSKAWIKDKVTGSLNKLASTKSSYSSIDTVHQTSEDLLTSPSSSVNNGSDGSLSKSQSESNLKTASSLTNV